jgi:hypothetical protein
MAKDAQGKDIKLGDKVARAAQLGATIGGLYVIIAEVTKVNGDKVYLDNSRSPMKFPDRIAVIS